MCLFFCIHGFEDLTSFLCTCQTACKCVRLCVHACRLHNVWFASRVCPSVVISDIIYCSYYYLTKSCIYKTVCAYLHDMVSLNKFLACMHIGITVYFVAQ